jgi:hypothetical protein
MPNGEDEGQPPEDTGEDQPTEDQPTEDTGETPTDEGSDQPLSGEIEPASQPDEGVAPQEPDAGVPTPEELDEMEQAMTDQPRKEMGPLDEFETALAEADTTGDPSEIDPTSVA